MEIDSNGLNDLKGRKCLEKYEEEKIVCFSNQVNMTSWILWNGRSMNMMTKRSIQPRRSFAFSGIELLNIILCSVIGWNPVCTPGTTFRRQLRAIDSKTPEIKTIFPVNGLLWQISH